MLDLLPLVAAIAFSSAPAKPHAAATSAPALRYERAEELLSKRALRRARLVIQLRLFELRDERLECVRKAILRRLPWDLRPPDPLRDCLEADSPLK